MCLHGITQTAHSWDEVAPALARTHHVRALDQRGHGDSAWAPDGDYRIETQSRDVEQFVRALGPEPAVLVALSMGGLERDDLAARAPEVVRALVVVDIAPQVAAQGRRAHPAASSPPTTSSTRSRTSSLARTPSIRGARSRTFATACGTTSGSCRAAAGRGSTIRRCAIRHAAAGDIGDLWERVEAIRCPVLSCAAARATSSSPEIAARLGRIVHAEVRTVPGAGHSVMGDNPSGFLAAVEPFLAAIAAPP